MGMSPIEIVILRPKGDRSGLEIFLKLESGECLTKELGILTVTRWAEIAIQEIGQHIRARVK